MKDVLPLFELYCGELWVFLQWSDPTIVCRYPFKFNGYQVDLLDQNGYYDANQISNVDKSSWKVVVVQNEMNVLLDIMLMPLDVM